MHRRIKGLQEVELCENPFGKSPRQSGARALGLRFQRVVERALPAALHGQWLRFRDSNGLGYAQPDILAVQSQTLPSICRGQTLFQKIAFPPLLLIECKLTDTSAADGQMADLYRPLLSALWPGPIHQIVVVKYLSPATSRSRVVTSWGEALVHPAPILHAFSKRELTTQAGVYGKPSLLAYCQATQTGRG